MWQEATRQDEKEASMHTVRRTQTSRGWRRRHVRPLIAGAAAITAALSVMGLTAVAQAAPDVTLASAKTLNVPAGVATAVLSTACPSGTASLSSSKPALPASITVVVATTKLKLVGVWPASPTSYKLTIKCSGGTTNTLTVKIQSAPPENAAVGLGAQTQQSLVDQFSGDYNATLSSASATHLYNWDAINPVTGAQNDTITVKQNCASFPRPNGSSAGIKQLAAFAQTSDKKYYCDNFANSSRPRGSSDPTFGPGGVAFVSLAEDAVTWARPAANTFAPKSLTPTQLNQIWNCTVPRANNGTAVNQWGDLNPALTGSAATTPIKPFLPQSGSGTLTFWLAAIGVTTQGPCVTQGTLEENEGVNPELNVPGGIFIYSIGDYIAQKFHSAACTNSGCTANPPCTPTKGKNEFGCDVHGVLSLGEISGVAPTTGKNGGTVINSAFPTTFQRTLYAVVPYDSNTADHIPGSESTNGTAKLDIKNYGFKTIPTCGTAS
jgi:hypothetical protein